MMIPTSFETPPRPIQHVARELADSSGFLLVRLGFGLKAKALADVGQGDFELYDYTVLAILAEGVRATQVAIADAMMLDPSRLVALLDSLERRGLVARQRDPQDRRRHVVSITSAGERELERLRSVIRRIEDEFFAPLSAEDRVALHALLVRLAVQNDPRCCPLEDSSPPGL